jgi:DNA-binding NarL/FixJ family response regulator
MTKIGKTQLSKLSKPKPTRSYVKRTKDHDIFVRGLLGINALVLKILLHYIPKNIQPFIDFSTLKVFPDKQIDNKLKLIEADSIHECALNVANLPESVQKQGNLPLFRFCFLWEHKSSKPNEPIEFQIESYRHGIIRADLKKEQEPSIVIPILLYHGADKWEKKFLYERVEQYLPPELLRYIPYPNYIIIDLQAMTEEEIEAATDLAELRGAFIALKYSHDENFFKQNMKKVLKFVDEMPTAYIFQEFFKMLIEYMQRRSHIEKEEFDEIVEQNLDTEMATRKVFKTSYEIVAEEAELKGKLEGLRQGVIALLMATSSTNAQIAKMLNVDEVFVKTIRQEFTATQ